MSISYVFACFVLGLGIGLDVILATLSRVKHLTSISGWTWIRRITTTHITFPMVGYYGFIELFYLFPALRMMLGIIAFSLIVYFLVVVVKGWFDASVKKMIGDPFSWSVVLSVSWDALFSGPAKSAQAIRWNQGQIFFSFFISGVFVALLTIIAVQVTFFLRRIATAILRSSVGKYVKLQLVMMLIEFIIFLYFGLLALTRYTFFSDIPSYQIGFISSFIGITIFMFIRKRLISVVNEQTIKELLDSAANNYSELRLNE